MCRDDELFQQTMIHVHDLPQLYTRPSSRALLETLDLLRLSPSSFANTTTQRDGDVAVDPEGVANYLTSIVSSSLSWFASDEDREQVWDKASVRLSERAGRNAMSNMTRSFKINDDLTIELHEPSLTEDNLGFKTWTSSLLLARRLPSLREVLPVSQDRVLELGAGTGLVGIAAACMWHINVVLTDLPDIVPNLQRNVESNIHLIGEHGLIVETRVLDWSDISCVPETDFERFKTILAADPIYSSDHPKILAETVQRWLSLSSDARFVVELPLRKGYGREREDLKSQLQIVDLELLEEGTEVGYDDWRDQNGQLMEVECWWSIWGPSPKRMAH